MLESDSSPIAWINGQLVPIAEARLHVFDMGLVHGAAVTEMLRTFRHRPFRGKDHLDRLFDSVAAVGIDLAGLDKRDQLEAILNQVVEHNTKLIPDTHDLGIIVFATLGENLTYVGSHADRSRATLCVHTFPLPFGLWAEKMSAGQHLVIPKVKAVPPDCIDPRIKHRSRLPWILADQEARKINPAASALVLDLEGRITETSSGNFFAVIEGEIMTPPKERCLGGISQKVVQELAGELKIPYHEDNLTPADLEQTAEAFTSSTPYCVMPVKSIDGKTIGEHCPGEIFRKLIEAWNELVGLDIIGQIANGERGASAP